jgi:hypothetical protein
MVSKETDDLDRVMTLEEYRRRRNISRYTEWAERKKGRGPILTRLSERKLGVRERHFREWLDRQALNPAEETAA